MLAQRLAPFVLALAIMGCESHASQLASLPSATATSSVPATLAASAAGTAVTVTASNQLPADVQNASKLQVGVSGTLLDVSRAPDGTLSFLVPSNTAISRDASGNVLVFFVVNTHESVPVLLATGAQVTFGTPIAATTPSSGSVALGQTLHLVANTPASEASYQFAWSAAPSASGPFQSIPGAGKAIDWTPAQTGNYFIKIDAIDRASHQTSSAVSGQALVLVTSASDVIGVTPSSGFISLGQAVTLAFKRPDGISGNNLHYAWAAGQSPQGPFTPITGDAASVSWTPGALGSYFIQLQVSDDSGNRVSTFVTPTVEVVVGQTAGLVTPSKATVNRGDSVDLTLDAGAAAGAAGPIVWYAAPAGSPTFTRIQGATGTTIHYLAADAGTYNFRVDVPQANGTVTTLTTSQPVLNVVEAAALITPSQSNVQRGDAVTLTLNAGADAAGPIVWYVAPSGSPSFTRIQGVSGKSIQYIATDAGAFNFKVDLPRADGTVASLSTSQPVLDVVESQPLIVADPPNTLIGPGSAVTLRFNARGLAEGAWHFVWSVSLSPSGGFTTLPLVNVDDLTRKSRTWRTSAGAFATPSGAYYVKVDATEVDGTRAFSFVSSSPVVFVQQQ